MLQTRGISSRGGYKFVALTVFFFFFKLESIAHFTSKLEHAVMGTAVPDFTTSQLLVK